MVSNAVRVSIVLVALGGRGLAQPQPEPEPQGSQTPPPVEPQEPPAPESNKVEAPPPPVIAPIPPPPPVPVAAPASGDFSRADMMLVGGSAMLFGASVALFFAGTTVSKDADSAALYSAHEDISATSRRYYLLSGLTFGGAVALGVTAYLHIRKSGESSTNIAIAPRSGGGAVVLGGSW